MSQSNLSSTSGALSQIASKSDGQEPSSEKQHPLLLSAVLVNLFSYLTFAELKISRHVCKAWSEVAVPFIGRRKLKPVNFSDITHEDFLALKQEFIKFPSKVKYFQGFQLKWDEMNVMIWNNFLSSFNPSELVIFGGYIFDPTKLNNLLQPVLTTLTDLSLDVACLANSWYHIIDLLNNLAVLQPLALKSLKLDEEIEGELDLTPDKVIALFRAFERVFQSQSQTLEKLKFVFCCAVDGAKYNFEGIQLQWPVFPRLRHLELDLGMSKLFAARGESCISLRLVLI